MNDRMASIEAGHTRGEILKLVRTRHRGQQSRMDHVMLWQILRGIGIDVGEDDVLTYLQDLQSMDCIKFVSEQNRRTNRTSITLIEMCSRGLRILEGNDTEPSVLL